MQDSSSWPAFAPFVEDVLPKGVFASSLLDGASTLAILTEDGEYMGNPIFKVRTLGGDFLHLQAEGGAQAL